MSQVAEEFWPPVPDFNPMLQNPNYGFADAELKTCQIQRDGNNQPRPRAGNFAVCYKGTYSSTGKDVCIRLFARKSEERRDRYAEISAHLKAHPIECLVKFEYIEKGIRHPNPAKFGNRSWFPIIRMDWIEGSILFDWLRERCQAKDSRAIANAADQWIEVAQQLESVGIAHCDLQHANVMVTPAGKLKLVDYDCMCVPALVGRPNLELGVEPYQHPERTESTTLFPGMDHFSELFILVVLRALAADPQLWYRHIEPPGGEPYDKLLIRKSDFDAPDQSVLVAELKRSPDPEVSRLATELFKLAKGPLKAVPSLATFVFNFDEVRSLFRQRAWDEGLELLNRGSSKALPKDIESEAARARQYVQARTELERALQSGDERQIQAAYKPQLLDNYPRAQASVQAAKLSTRVQSILSQLDAARGTRNWRQFVSVWDAEKGILTGRKSAERYRSEAESWRERNELSARVQRLRAARPIDISALDEACKSLVSRGGHPEIDADLPEIRRLIDRHTALGRIQSVPALPTLANDLALVAAWNESLFAGWQPADPERPRLSAARGRLLKIEALRDAIKIADAARSVDHEKGIRNAVTAIPPGYDLDAKLQSRIDAADQCLAAVDQIEQALAKSAPSERLLVRCAGRLADLNALSLVPSLIRGRLELAVQRLPLLEKLAAIPMQGPVESVDAAIRAAWNDQLLLDCADALPWKQRAVDAHTRAVLLARLEAALDSANDSAVVDLLDEPLLQGYPFGATLSARIGTARKKSANVRAMLDALRDNRDEDFSKYFDHQIVKANLPLFMPYEAKIKEVLGREVLPIDKVGLSKPRVGKSISNESGQKNRYRIQWEWPARRITDHCVLGICQGIPDGHADPATVAVHRIPVDRKNWEMVGAVSLIAKPAWRSRRADVVAVWAVIDAGFDTLYSEPLVLGRVSHQEA